MRLSVLSVPALAGLVLFAGGTALGAVFVIPPGQETLLQGALAPVGKSKGCALRTAKVEKSVVRAEYDCGGKQGVVTVLLRHVSQKAGRDRSTRHFAVGGEPASRATEQLIEEATVAVRAIEDQFRWQELSAADRGPAATASAPLAPVLPETAASGNAGEKYARALQLYRERRFGAALELFLELAREPRKQGVFGMIAASLAPEMHDDSKAEAYAKAADAAPTDGIAQFLAGAAFFFTGQQTGTSRGAKRRSYTRALPYLDRAVAAYPRESQAVLLSALASARVGRATEATPIVERALALAPDFPLVYLARAEISHATNRSAAIADLEKYLALCADQAKRGASMSPAELERVRAILAALQKGTATPTTMDHLFDPLRSPTGGGAPAAAGSTFDTAAVLVVVGTAGAFALLLFAMWWMRRRSPPRPGSTPPG